MSAVAKISIICDGKIAQIGDAVATASENNSAMSGTTLTRRISNPATLLGLLALPVLLVFGNPAIALMTGAALVLVFDREIVPFATELGRYALQTAIVLLGFKLDAGQLVRISADYSLLVTAYVLLVIVIGLALGRLLGNSGKSSQLLASGTAICGGTTIASLSPVINARPEETGVALTLVFLLNAVALFTFPYIGHALALSQEQFGVWAALAIHDTSSVVATAALYGDEAATVATTVKLGRTLWLIPLLLVASVLNQAGSARLRVPRFVVLFVLAACLGSIWQLPAAVTAGASLASKLLLVSALFCIGTQISRDTLKHLSARAVSQALLLWALAAPVVLGLVLFLG